MRDIDNIIDDLEKLQKELEEWRDSLKETQDEWNPIFPQPSTPIEITPNPRCSLCQLELHPVMGYVCSRVDCPTGLGGPTCVSNSADGRTTC